MEKGIVYAFLLWKLLKIVCYWRYWRKYKFISVSERVNGIISSISLLSFPTFDSIFISCHWLFATEMDAISTAMKQRIVVSIFQVNYSSINSTNSPRNCASSESSLSSLSVSPSIHRSRCFLVLRCPLGDNGMFISLNKLAWPQSEKTRRPFILTISIANGADRQPVSRWGRRRIANYVLYVSSVTLWVSLPPQKLYIRGTIRVWSSPTTTDGRTGVRRWLPQRECHWWW